MHTESYLPGEAYQALVNDLACALSPYHALPADRLAAVTAVLFDHDLHRPELAVLLTEAERWPVLEEFEGDQVRYLLGEEGGIWPESIREEIDQDDRPIIFSVATPADQIVLPRPEPTSVESERSQAIPVNVSVCNTM